jgi:hypothetical protein
MKLKKASILLVILAMATFKPPYPAGASIHQSAISYQQMTAAERMAFVSAQARRIALRMSGSNYEFTSGFEAEIQRAIGSYATRIGNNGGDRLGSGDARFIFQRGQSVAPMLIRVFKARNVSPLLGLYIPMIESEYVNIESANSVGAIGMFQFLPKTGQHYGLTADELLDVEKSADAAARYLAANLKRFNSDAMKEALAMLAYNRGESNVERDLASFVNEQNRACSICALTEQREQLDKTFREESVYYVPRFFAAAIIGENPQVFGLETQPLSSFDVR